MDATESDQNTDGGASAGYSKRPVSMFEPREGLHTTKSIQIPDSRTTTSMYQMIDGLNQATNGSNNGTSLLPHADEVKYRTEVVTRRIQELWIVMQEMTSNDAFVPCAERIHFAVADLIAIFPVVSCKFKL